MNASLASPRSAALAPFGALALSMVSVQLGASFAKRLFPLVGAEGATALRVSLAALILIGLFRPWRRPPSRAAWPTLVGYGLVLGAMNLSFYLSLKTIPLGIAVALEFTGPLAVAMAASRRWLDFVWIGFAGAGLVALLLLGAGRALDPAGVGLALAAGLCWGLYIILGQKAGEAHGAQAAAVGMAIAVVVVAPIGLVRAGSSLFVPSTLLTALLVAALSSAVPYSLEMVALTRLPRRVFGILMSGEPALGAGVGFVVLHETLSLRQEAAIAAIVVASIGTATTNRRELEEPGATPA